MDKKRIKDKVSELLSSGNKKSEVFAQLSGQCLKDNQLAYLIAAYASPSKLNENNGKVNLLVTLMFIFSLIAFFIGFAIGAKIGSNAQWIFGILTALIPLIFAWGFYNHKVGAYNAYILLTIVQLPKSLVGFTSDPIATSIGLAINIALLAYVWYVREKIFPGFMLMTPKKIKGEYIFEG